VSKHVFRLYVVGLTDTVVQSGRFRRANASGGDAGCLYVGSTAHEPEHRLDQHRSGRLANRGWVTKYGTGLRTDLMPSVAYPTREEAEAAEAALAARLRKEGYQVWSR
jgi:predicted GIY-YIG superfamily endonuclease